MQAVWEIFTCWHAGHDGGPLSDYKKLKYHFAKASEDSALAPCFFREAYTDQDKQKEHNDSRETFESVFDH